MPEFSGTSGFLVASASQSLQNGCGWVQGSAVAETLESSRRWSGFVCPDCRFVFRVPRDHEGRGIVCPSCRRMLRIPRADEQTPLLVAAVKSVTAVAVQEQAGDDRVRRRKRKHAAKTEDWEKIHSADRAGQRDRFPAKWWLLGGGLGLSSVLALVATLMWVDRPDPPAPGAVGGGGVVAAPAPVESGGTSADGVERTLLSEADFLDQAEPLVKRFMEAGSIEELLPLLRNPEAAEPRLRAFYPSGTFAPYGYSKFNVRGSLETEGSIRAIVTANRDFEEKSLAFEESASGIKIDWESWIGWSEMPWSDFMSTKPLAGKLFRVMLSAVDYYNFSFTDDRKWRSYRLTSPDGQYALYAYVERDSVLDSKLRLPSDVKQSSVALKLKYPADPLVPNQVIIERLVSESWVLPNETSQ